MSFQIFDATAFTGKPAVTLPHTRQIRLASGVCTPTNKDVPDESYCRALARAAATSGNLLCLDVEHWLIDQRLIGKGCTADDIDKNLGKLSQVCDWVHDECPQVRLGYYSLMPMRDYWSACQYPLSLQHAGESWWDGKRPQFETDYKVWQAANDRIRYRLSNRVDVLFPSLYTFSTNQEGWEQYAAANIDEAKRYGKSIYPFLWFQYHDSTSLKGQAIPADYWQRQLKLVRALCDGLVIWGGYQQQWDANAGWWQATKKFLGQ